MNVLRHPRAWASPIARLYHGATRSITTSSLLPAISETAPNAFRRTEKSASSFPKSFSRTLLTDSSSQSSGASPETALETASENSSTPPRNPKGVHLPYQILKTKSGNLPVYEVTAAGRIKSTVVRKVKGDHRALADDIIKALKIPEYSVRVNHIAGLIEVKGKWSYEIKKFLREQGLGESFQPLV